MLPKEAKVTRVGENQGNKITFSAANFANLNKPLTSCVLKFQSRLKYTFTLATLNLSGKLQL
jgi:hypothetical protein